MWVVFEAGIHQGSGRRYFVGLEVAGDNESSGFSIIEQRRHETATASPAGPNGPAFGSAARASYIIRHLERLRRDGRDPAALDVRKACELPIPIPPWVVHDGRRDARGDVGLKRVVGMLEECGLHPVAVTLTRSGSAHRPAIDGIAVRQTDVIAAMTTLFENRELKLASMVAAVPEFLSQLQALHTLDPAGRDDSRARRGSRTDDLVLCTALAVWYGMRHVAQSSPPRSFNRLRLHRFSDNP